MSVPEIISIVVLLVIAGPVIYLYILAGAAVRPPFSASVTPSRKYRFAIAIPAHDEASVIGGTVARLRKLDYPAELYDIHVVADHCADDTTDAARASGAIVHERTVGPRGSKGAALRWLFERMLADTSQLFRYDAVVVFDADTHVALDFLTLMSARLDLGDDIIQGQHRIRNPEDGWFPSLVWAMFIVDNRLQNQGRTRLGWSAKNMGDSICFRADVLRKLGWGEGLTEDYAFRHRLLLEGYKITYEPRAVGRGEAPLSWRTASAQRARWLRGTRDASRRYARELLVTGLQRLNMPLLDGALQAMLPSYSTLTVLAAAGLVINLVWMGSGASAGNPTISSLWAALTLVLIAYPIIGLRLERAPARAYAAMLLGPGFVLWRTRLALASRLRREVTWIRTPRKTERGGLAADTLEASVR